MPDLNAAPANESAQAERLAKFTAANFLPKPRLWLKLPAQTRRLRASVAEALFYFYSNQSEKITERHVSAVEKLFKTVGGNIKAFARPARIVNAIEAVESANLATSKAGLQQLIAECRQENFPRHLVLAATSGHLALPSPFSDGKAVCQESYEIDKELSFLGFSDGSQCFNCLRFTDGDQCFFLLQEVCSANSLYFPQDHVLVDLWLARANHAKNLLTVLCGQFRAAVTYTTAANKFGGIIASHSRPGHFFYDIFPPLVEVFQQPKLAEQIPCFILRQDHDFCDLKRLYEKGAFLTLSSGAIAERAFAGQQWFVHVGNNPHLRGQFWGYEAVDQFLIDQVLAAPTANDRAKVETLAGCYPVVWIGVEGQKRCWLEQVAGYAFILNQLAERYPHLGVVIDGWTLPLTPSKKSLAEVNKDKRVAKKLLRKLNPAIKQVQLVGETSHTKLIVGQQVDFFIGNFATGSLYVSRMLGKPGFCHLSRQLGLHSLRHNIQIHANKQVYLLPLDYMIDNYKKSTSFLVTVKWLFLPILMKLLNKPVPRRDFGTISYSIDKTQFWQFIESRLEKILNPPPPRLQLFIEPSFSIHTDVRQIIKMASYGNVLEVFPTLSFPRELADLAGKFSDRYLYNHLIYGLFPVNSHFVLDKPADYLVWLGDPLQRVKLHAVQFVKNAVAEDQTLTVDQVLQAGHKALDNYYTRYLSGLDAPFGGCDEAMLERAITNLRAHFVFIGINEQQADSFDRLCQVMDWDRSLFPDQQLAQAYTLEGYDFSDQATAFAEGLVSYDRGLYQAALAIISGQ